MVQKDKEEMLKALEEAVQKHGELKAKAELAANEAVKAADDVKKEKANTEVVFHTVAIQKIEAIMQGIKDL